MFTDIETHMLQLEKITSDKVDLYTQRLLNKREKLQEKFINIEISW